MTQIYRNLPLLLLKAREHFMTHFRPILNQHGITEQQSVIWNRADYANNAVSLVPAWPVSSNVWKKWN